MNYNEEDDEVVLHYFAKEITFDHLKKSINDKHIIVLVSPPICRDYYIVRISLQENNHYTRVCKFFKSEFHTEEALFCFGNIDSYFNFKNEFAAMEFIDKRILIDEL